PQQRLITTGKPKCAAGLSWPLPTELSEAELESALFPSVRKSTQPAANGRLPDWGYIQLLEKLNHRPFKKREGSRCTLFAELDRPAMRPLPSARFDLSV